MRFLKLCARACQAGALTWQSPKKAPAFQATPLPQPGIRHTQTSPRISTALNPPIPIQTEARNYHVPQQEHCLIYKPLCAHGNEVCMYACMYACMHVCMDGWMDGWMYVCMYVCMYGLDAFFCTCFFCTCLTRAAISCCCLEPSGPEVQGGQDEGRHGRR